MPRWPSNHVTKRTEQQLDERIRLAATFGMAFCVADAQLTPAQICEKYRGLQTWRQAIERFS